LLKFPNTEIPWAFIKSKADMDRNNFPLQVYVMQTGEQNELVLLSVEHEICSEEGQCLTCPNASIRRGWNDIISVCGFETRLGVLGYPRACKQSKAHPIIDRVFHCEESIHTIWLGLDKALKSLEHVNGIRLFLGSGLGPGCLLSELFPNVWMEMDLFLLECGLINYHTGALCQ
jgi:hypothetical protein